MNENSKKIITIVCCCYNEVNSIRKTYDNFCWLVEQCSKYDFEILFEDNCSTDGTQEIIRQIAAKDSHVKAIFNQANCGLANSSANAFCNVSGDAIIPIACDLQEPIEVIPEFLEYWEQGYDIVWGQKLQSEESKIKYHLRSVFYDIIDFFSDYKQFHHVTGFGVTDRKVLEAFKISKLQDPDVMLRNFVVEYNFNVKLIPYKQKKRAKGKSSYNLSKSLDFAISTLCNTSKKPLRIITVTGLCFSMVSFLALIIFIICKLVNWNSFVGTAPFLFTVLLFMISFQIFCIGLLGEYLNIILKKVYNKPMVIEKERLNFDENQPQMTTCGGQLSNENNNIKK